uniref:Putative gamma-interferon inducible lysosomal thiol reductase tabanus bromius n=1 Tax=Xenopsylla cheopis TaxID=163159 RepID=A0A6M2DWB6_XENCH
MFPSGAMRFRIIILILIIFLVWQIIRLFPGYSPFASLNKSHDALGVPVLVTVFYEALCPDSKSFVVSELLPSYTKAKSILDYELIPYGKAKTIENSDGTLSFECQHGPPECKANIIHACVLEILDDADKKLDVISCMIQDNILPDEALRTCAKLSNFDPEPVVECSISRKGAELLKKYGEATNALRPTITFIPTVLLDGSRGSQTAILKDLLGEVCKIVRNKDGNVPPQCK